MSDRRDNIGCVKEYENLRAEIMEDIKLYNSLTTLTLTAIIAFLGYLISENTKSYVLYFIPVPVIIAMSSRTLYYRRNISKISSYMIVFLESNIDDMKWETRNNIFENKVSFADFDLKILGKFSNSRIVKFVRKVLSFMRYTEFITIILACFFLYVYKICAYIKVSNFSFKHWIIIVMFIVAGFIEFIMTIEMNQTHVYREKCKEKWKEIQHSQYN